MFTYEDPAGNRVSSEPLLFFVDTQGPRITAVDINAAGNTYDLFDHKDNPDGVLVPTPLVDSLVISLEDLPDRTADFLYDAVFTTTAVDPVTTAWWAMPTA